MFAIKVAIATPATPIGPTTKAMFSAMLTARYDQGIERPFAVALRTQNRRPEVVNLENGMIRK